MRKKERSPVKGHEIGKLSSLPLEEEDRSDLKIILISILDKANLSLSIAKTYTIKNKSSLNQ